VGDGMADNTVLVGRGVHGAAPWLGASACKSAAFMAMWIARGRSYT
jgi:hypothetical protein